jgi:hypothetical protein
VIGSILADLALLDVRTNPFILNDFALTETLPGGNRLPHPAALAAIPAAVVKSKTCWRLLQVTGADVQYRFNRERLS